MSELRESAESLLAMIGEITDDELLTAAHNLRDVCAEHDEVNARFEAAGAEVKRILVGRLR